MRLTIPHSQVNQIHYVARKSHWGDLFPHQPKHRPLLRSTGPKAKHVALMSLRDDAAEEEDIDTAEEDRQFERSLGLNDPWSTKVAKVERHERARGGTRLGLSMGCIWDRSCMVGPGHTIPVTVNTVTARGMV